MEIKKFFRTPLFLFLLTVVACGPSAGAAEEQKQAPPPKAPKFPRKGTWIHSGPLTKKAFQEKMTLLYFWDYTSVNCIRELPALKRWYVRYHPYGFETILVHAPEFEFAREKKNVMLAARRLQIPFPIFLDNDYKLWEAYGTRSWPTKYLVNGEGRIVHTQVGEGGYVKTEERLRQELVGLNPSAVLPIPVLDREEEKFSLERCGLMSPETYLGHKRAGWWGGEIANSKGVLPDQTVLFRDRGKRVERGFFAEGLWANRGDHFEHARTTEERQDYVGLLYLAAEVYAVINQVGGGEVSRVYVTRDGEPVPPAYRGQDLREDALGGTYLLLEEPRLYYLIAKEEAGPHEIKLWAQEKGVAINSLSFSNQCLNDFDHL